jgi:hypothetical protein
MNVAELSIYLILYTQFDSYSKLAQIDSIYLTLNAVGYRNISYPYRQLNHGRPIRSP